VRPAQLGERQVRAQKGRTAEIEVTVGCDVKMKMFAFHRLIALFQETVKRGSDCTVSMATIIA
jgi:hypothetical protein